METYDSAIWAQLYQSSTISPKNENPQDTDTEQDGNKPHSATQDRGVQRFTSAALIQLLEMLEIPTAQILDTPLGGFLDNIIGWGGFGTVGYHELDESPESKKIPVAVKSFSPITKDSDNVKEIENISEGIITQAYIEICIMKEPYLATHANIVKLRGVMTSGWGSATLRLSLITEYADLGSLDSYISLHHKELEWNLKIQILSDIVSGLTALHDCDIVHNDVKCANILLFVSPGNDRITAKVADFGCSVPLALTMKIRRASGTRMFAPPEAYASDCPVRMDRDIYSFGLLIVHVACGSPPLPVIDEDLKNNEIRLQEYVRSGLMAVDTPPPVIEVTLNALQMEPQKRPSMKQILRQL